MSLDGAVRHVSLVLDHKCLGRWAGRQVEVAYLQLRSFISDALVVNHQVVRDHELKQMSKAVAYDANNTERIY